MPNPRQIAAAQKKLEKLKQLLAPDKKERGVHDDSRGLRYLSPALFIQIEDWTGGLKYLKWFQRNFPDDSGTPEFLFEWSVILFKNNLLTETTKKAYQVYFSNTYLLDGFLGRPIIPVSKWEGSNWETPSYLQHVSYSLDNPLLADFSAWLMELTSTEQFLKISEEFIRLNTKLNGEQDQEIRTYFVAQITQLETSLL